MLMMLQNLDNAASAVVVDTSEYLAVATATAISARGSNDAVSAVGQDSSVSAEAD